jgi:hypothetical protein
MARSKVDQPVVRLSVGQMTPGNVKERTFHPNGVDGYTGPSYSNRRGNSNVQGTSKPVARFGVATGNRGEWKR